MKKTFIATLFITMFFLSGCNFNLSNLDVQKLNNKASEYMQSGEYDKAASRLEAIIELNPDLPETYYNLGIAYYNMKEYEKATDALGNALLRNPEFADAYFSRAVAFEEWAFSSNENENEKENKTNEENIKEKEIKKEYLKEAKSDYQNYLKFKSDAEDKEDVIKKIEQIDKDLSEDNTEE